MKHLKVLGAALVAIFALSATAAATASAEALPNILPLGTAAAPLTSTSSSGKSEFGNGFIKLVSQKSKGTNSSTGTTGKTGTLDVLFEEVKNVLGESCTSLDSTAKSGSILVKANFDVRAYKNAAGELKTAELVLIPSAKAVHFTCGASTTLLIVLGCVAGAISPEGPPAVNTVTVTLKKVAGKNDNEIITVLNEANTANENCELLASSNESTFELSSEETTQTLTTFKKAGAAVSVEVMKL